MSPSNPECLSALERSEDGHPENPFDPLSPYPISLPHRQGLGSGKSTNSADACLYFAITFLAILFSDITGTLPVIPTTKVTLFRHIESTKRHTHKIHVQTSCFLCVFLPGSTDFISAFYHNLRKLSSQQGPLWTIIWACVNELRALVIHTGCKNKKMCVPPICFSPYMLELNSILPVWTGSKWDSWFPKKYLRQKSYPPPSISRNQPRNFLDLSSIMQGSHISPILLLRFSSLLPVNPWVVYF